MADGCGCGCGALDARLYTHNQRNIEYNFIFTQETRLNYVAQSDIIYIIRYVRWELVFLRIYAQQEMGFCYGYKSLSTKICGRYITVYYGILRYCKRISVANTSTFRDNVCFGK